MRKERKNRIRLKIHITNLIIFTILLHSCSDKTANNEVVVDSNFTSLFQRTGEGFTGGDGTYSVELPDGRSVWIFGDTFLGTIEPDGSRKKSTPMYIRNSMVVQEGNNLTTIFQKINGQDHSTIIPPKVIDSDFKITEEMQWYWPGDGFIENNKLKIFLSEFHQTDTGMWGFEWKGIALASFSIPDLKQTGIKYFNYDHNARIHFGHAVLQDGNYTYIYGLGEGKPYVARAKAGNIEGPWEFYTNNGWSLKSEESIPIADIEGSEQFSVLKWKGKYILITQLGGFSKEICSFTSDNPYSGWKNKQVLYTTPIPENNPNLFTYNALAHPQFTKNNMLLISYNTNSYALEDHFIDAGIYRPRFIRVPLKLIHPDF